MMYETRIYVPAGTVGQSTTTSDLWDCVTDLGEAMCDRVPTDADAAVLMVGGILQEKIEKRGFASS